MESLCGSREICRMEGGKAPAQSVPQVSRRWTETKTTASPSFATHRDEPVVFRPGHFRVAIGGGPSLPGAHVVLHAWYGFDEGEGNDAFDSSRHHIKAVLADTADLQRLDAPAGSRALTADGGATPAATATSSFDMSGDVDVTIMAWVKWEGGSFPSDTQVHVLRMSTGDLDMSFLSSRLTFTVIAGGPTAIATSPSISTASSSWVHVAAVRRTDGGAGLSAHTIQLLVNGESVPFSLPAGSQDDAHTPDLDLNAGV